MSEKFQSRIEKTILLENYSIYVHTAHDDEMYHHYLTFPKTPTNQMGKHVRFAMVFRWLGVSTYFRCSPNDFWGHRFGAVDKHAFQKLMEHKHSDKWFQAMGYVDANVNNVIKTMMDVEE